MLLARRPLPPLILLTIILLAGHFFIGTSLYQADSWAFYELSQTLTRGDFYKFNTIRSYYSNTFSAAFPFGYPALLGFLHMLFGRDEQIAVYVNIISAILTVITFQHIGKKLNIPSDRMLLLAVSLVFWPAYLDELYAGRVIPTTILFFLFAFDAFLFRHHFLCGLLLGIAALFRFDYLAYGILFQTGAVLLCDAKRLNNFLVTFSGFFLGLLPWTIFSFQHFGVFWASDSAWLTLSAVHLKVLNFPAYSSLTIFTSPALWLQRICLSTAITIIALLMYSLSYPMFICAIALLLKYVRLLSRLAIKHVIVIALLTCAALAPYILPGYYNPRYFSLILCVSSSTVLIAFYKEASDSFAVKIDSFVTVFALLALASGLIWIANKAWEAHQKTPLLAEAEKAFLLLKECQLKTPNLTYLFTQDADKSTAWYGARTGMKTAYIPSNFHSMTNEERERFYDYIRPYYIVKTLKNLSACPTDTTY